MVKLPNLCVLAFPVALLMSFQAPTAIAKPLWFYCGTYTRIQDDLDVGKRGIGIYQLDSISGEITRVGSFENISKSSHLCLGHDHKFLYSVSEVNDYQGKPSGSVTVFSVDQETKSLAQLQTISSYGQGPCYVRVDPSGKFLLLANYRSGNAVIYPIQDDGTLGEPTAKLAHSGSSVNPLRQEGPHAHSIITSPDNQFLFVPDLGIDRIAAYNFSTSDGLAERVAKLDVITPPGSGPRHLVFSPSGKWAYASLELSSEVAAYAFENGRLSEVCRLSTLPEDFSGSNTCAEVRVSPNGKNVYLSNRGHDSLAVFSVKSDMGKLERVQIISTEGHTPRNFGISNNGNWVVVANQNSNSIVSYHRNPASGELRFSGVKIDCPRPVLIHFFPAD